MWDVYHWYQGGRVEREKWRTASWPGRITMGEFRIQAKTFVTHQWPEQSGAFGLNDIRRDTKEIRSNQSLPLFDWSYKALILSARAVLTIVENMTDLVLRKNNVRNDMRRILQIRWHTSRRTKTMCDNYMESVSHSHERTQMEDYKQLERGWE